MIDLKNNKLSIAAVMLGASALFLVTLAAYVYSVTGGVENTILTPFYSWLFSLFSSGQSTQVGMSEPGLFSIWEKKAIYLTQGISLCIAAATILLAFVARKKGENSIVHASAAILGLFTFLVFNKIVGIVVLFIVFLALILIKVPHTIET